MPSMNVWLSRVRDEAGEPSLWGVQIPPCSCSFVNSHDSKDRASFCGVLQIDSLDFNSACDFPGNATFRDGGSRGLPRTHISAAYGIGRVGGGGRGGGIERGGQ